MGERKDLEYLEAGRRLLFSSNHHPRTDVVEFYVLEVSEHAVKVHNIIGDRDMWILKEKLSSDYIFLETLPDKKNVVFEAHSTGFITCNEPVVETEIVVYGISS